MIDEVHLQVALNAAHRAIARTDEARAIETNAMETLAREFQIVAGLTPGERCTWDGKRYWLNRVHASRMHGQPYVWASITEARKDGERSERKGADLDILAVHVTPGWPEDKR